MKTRQRGVALVTAMLIVAIVAVVATSLALGQQVWLRQTQNLVDLAQAERLRQAALEFAAALLVDDARRGPIDHLMEPWAQPVPPLPVEGGTVVVSIADAQARLNLNNLAIIPPGQPNHYIPVLARLLTLHDLPPLADALIDWLDNDLTVRPGGAEDLDYLNHDPPYRAANRALTSVDELRLVKGFTPEMVAALRDDVVALPTSLVATPININTASAAVLAALGGIDPTQAEQLVKARETNPFTDPKQVQSLMPGAVPQTYNLQSGYFIVSVQVRIGRVERRTEALIERTTGPNARAMVLWYRELPYPIVLDLDEADT